MKNLKILFCEDDINALSKILSRLYQLEMDFYTDISVMVLSEHTHAEELNKSNLEFDLIFLDRDCKACGSFHVLDIEKFGVDKVVAISSMPGYNIEAQSRGVTRVIEKNYKDLDGFADKIQAEVREYLISNH